MACESVPSQTGQDLVFICALIENMQIKGMQPFWFALRAQRRMFQGMDDVFQGHSQEIGIFYDGAYPALTGGHGAIRTDTQQLLSAAWLVPFRVRFLGKLFHRVAQQR